MNIDPKVLKFWMEKALSHNGPTNVMKEWRSIGKDVVVKILLVLFYSFLNMKRRKMEDKSNANRML